MYERMEKMKDVENMTIEGFFLADYQNLRKENEQMRQEIAEQKRENISQYGVFDLGEGADMVKVSMESKCYYTGDYNLKNYTSEEVESILNKSNDELMNWAETFNLGDWSGRPIKIEKKHYRFTVRVVDMDGQKTYAFDPRYSHEVVLIGASEPIMADNLGSWMPADMLDSLKKAALDEVRQYLQEARDKKIDEEKGEQQ